MRSTRDSEVLADMKLLGVLLQTVLVLALEDSDSDCSAGEQCIPFSQCPSFLSVKNTRSKLEPTSQLYKQLSASLKSRVCDKIGRGVCCLQSTNITKGSPLSAFSGEISGGRRAGRNEFPFLARLRIQGPRGATGYCSGSLLTSRLIITAKHCFYNEKGYDFERYCTVEGRCVAILGEHHLDFPDPGEQKISILTVHLVPGKPESDLAVIELEEPVVLDNLTAGVVKVSRTPLVPGDLVTTAGWGLTGKYSGLSNVLKKINLEVSRVEGEEVYTKVEVVDGIPVDPCEGDSGGPLLVWREDSWTLAATLFGGGYVCERGNSGEFEGDGVWNSVATNYDWVQSLLTVPSTVITSHSSSK